MKATHFTKLYWAYFTRERKQRKYTQGYNRLNCQRIKTDLLKNVK